MVELQNVKRMESICLKTRIRPSLLLLLSSVLKAMFLQVPQPLLFLHGQGPVMLLVSVLETPVHST